jgi:hypothetical protein
VNLFIIRCFDPDSMALINLLAVLALAVVILLADFADGNDGGGFMPDDLPLVISK